MVHEGRPGANRWTFYIGEDGMIQEIDKMVDTKAAAAEIAANSKNSACRRSSLASLLQLAFHPLKPRDCLPGFFRFPGATYLAPLSAGRILLHRA